VPTLLSTLRKGAPLAPLHGAVSLREQLQGNRRVSSTRRTINDLDVEPFISVTRPVSPTVTARVNRQGGLDLARGIAVLGMVAVNYGLIFSGEAVLGSERDVWSRLLSLPAGDASATFVVLAGMGLGMRGLSARSPGVLLAEVARRAAVLLGIGALHFAVWPPDILHLYGVMILLSLPTLFLRPAVLVAMAALVVLGYIPLLGVLNYEAGWDFSTLTYLDNSLAGHIRRVFFNGFHPVVPWVAFLWIGIATARAGIGSQGRAWSLLGVGGVLALVAFGISRWAQASTNEPDLQALWGTESIPPGPLYMACATGVALSLIGACLVLDHHPRLGMRLNPVRRLGRVALTAYLSHVAAGVAVLALVPEGKTASWFAVLATVVFSVLAVGGAHLLVTRYGQGPLERLVRRIAARRD